MSVLKGWSKTLRCFSVPAVDVKEDISPTQKAQFLSDSWFETEQDVHWWRLGMKMLRWCKRKNIKDVNDLMKAVANYNNNGKLLDKEF